MVTGANHGIGAATAVRLAELGADVAIGFLRTHDAEGSDEYNLRRSGDGSDVAAAVAALGRRAELIEADLSDPTAPATLFDRAERSLGPVSVLVHNASGWRGDTFAPQQHDAVGRRTGLVTDASADAQYLVDARAGALLIAEFARRHRDRRAEWGRIVTLTSGDGGAFPGEVSYGAAKAALVSYSLSAASELASEGIAVNVVHPPVTDTGWVTDEVRAFVAADDGHHHVAQPDEVAEVIAWLCGDAGRLVTGNVMRLR